MNNQPELTDSQKYALKMFYEKPDVRISLDKKERSDIWDHFVVNRSLENILELQESNPALYYEMQKALNVNKNIQPAVFSECVYSQALADKLGLDEFRNHIEIPTLQIDHSFSSEKTLDEFAIRYSYSHAGNTKTLIQAGGARAVDCALISKLDDQVVRIEFKEPYARTSEPDLPKYAEDGILVTSASFDKKYPQFKAMLKEHLDSGFNVFDHLGNNEAHFSEENIETAVFENYTGDKFADVMCTEDENGYLVMIPVDHVSKWARLEGEIRPTGRNSYKVWTPRKLEESLRSIGAQEVNGKVNVQLKNLKTANARGSSKLSRYKINPLFFVRATDVEVTGDKAIFDKSAVKQLRPSITAKMNFEGLEIARVRDFYQGLI